MCNFAAELKHVANKEKLVDIQWDNTFQTSISQVEQKGKDGWERKTATILLQSDQNSIKRWR